MFSRWCEGKRLNRKESLDALILCLEGRPLEFVMELSEDAPYMTLTDVLHALDEYYEDDYRAETARQKMEAANQSRDESVREWAMRALTLAKQAYGRYGMDLVHTEAITKFCVGAMDKEAAEFVLLSKPKSLEEAKTMMLEKSRARERVQKKSAWESPSRVGVHTVSRKPLRDNTESHMLRENSDTDSTMTQLLQAITQQNLLLQQILTKLSANSSDVESPPRKRRRRRRRSGGQNDSDSAKDEGRQQSGQRRRRQRSGGQNDSNDSDSGQRRKSPPKSKRCYHCDEEGHLIARCPRRLREQENEQGARAGARPKTP